MTKNDTLQKALIHIDKLQHQVDSLKTLSSNKIEILQSQLDQSNNTVSNLGSLSTAWGTTYAVSAVIIGIVTIALAVATYLVPRWLKKKSRKAIRKLELEFSQKITLLDTNHKIEIQSIHDTFSKRYGELSEANGLEIQDLKTNFSEITKELEYDYKKTTNRIENNLWVHRAQSFEDKGRLDQAAIYYLIAAIGHQSNSDGNPTVTNSNLEAAVTCLSKLEKFDVVYMDSIINKLSFVVNIEDYFGYFEELDNFDAYNDNIEKLKGLIEKFKET